ncbi:MAG TPA: GDP-mannose 4,6-dehydratase [Candidatus Vogelbacteria bacterium]|nr:GDP-mannose 4,6-dehydratase [Candidatus Vogelbacteria bacterium]
MKKALITGITGQDGSYLAELLIEKGYEVHGVIRRSSTFNTSRINHLYRDPHDRSSRLSLHYGDVSDSEVIRKLIYQIKPGEIYNLAAQSHVRVSFDIPEYTANCTALGPLRILEAIRDYQEHEKKTITFYQASSSEMFGATPPPQGLQSPFNPQSPYGCSKVFAYHSTRLYRNAYGIFAVNGILFNHESPRRGETFVTRKITRGIARIKAGLEKKIFLGNLDARRDWGYAKEYMEAAWRMMQQKKSDDYVVGTGESHSIREFLECAFEEAGLGNYQKYVAIDPRYYRPAEVHDLVADAAETYKKLGWKPRITFKKLVSLMVRADLKEYGIKK